MQWLSWKKAEFFIRMMLDNAPRIMQWPWPKPSCKTTDPSLKIFNMKRMRGLLCKRGGD
jgi:hypothetical protein